MKIRLGYVAIALNLDKVTSSSTLTYKRYTNIKTEEERVKKLKEVLYSNIDALEKILKYNIDNNIHFYRITSNLIPLATHPEVSWEYEKYFKKDFEYIGKIIKDSNMRVDTHPDQFNVINSDKDHVVKNTIETLKVQASIFDYINYDDGKMVIHVGSGQGGKEVAIDRFLENLKLFPKYIVDKLIIENDDKIFTASDTLSLCKRANLPMVLDIHHHLCNNNRDDIGDLLEEIFDTWNNENIPPKIHVSSPKESEFDKKHSDFINVEDLNRFLDIAKSTVDRDFDIMIEAKQKDIALFKLVNDLKETRSDIKFIDETTFEI